MSNKSGTAAQVISLPAGGGAISGIGETFTPDLFTGTGNLSIPLAVPTGRNGFQPKLTLGYSSGAGNGPFGLGWSLDLAIVSRRTARGVPRYDDGDTFVLAGGEELVVVARDDETTRFRPRTEGLFADIRHRRAASGDLWRVRTRDGLESELADTVVDPDDARRIFSWRLSRTVDTFGNEIRYHYSRDDEGGPQQYLDRIEYIDDDRVGERRYVASLSFRYEERPDAFTELRPGFELRTRLRCVGIDVATHARGDRAVRSYELHYGAPARNGASLLRRVTCVGIDGDRRESLPPLDLGYTDFEPERRRFVALVSTRGALPAVSLAHPTLETASLSANGLPDLLEVGGGTARVWRNLGDGHFDEPQPLAAIPAGVSLADPDVQLADLDGDGRIDLLVLRHGGYYPVLHDGTFGELVPYAARPSVDFGEGELRLIDLDGDGVIDALRTGAAFELFFNDPRAGWTRVETVERGPIETFPDVRFSDPRVKLADLTGDGLQHIVLVDQGRIDYWPYLGHGRWGRRRTMEASPVFENGSADAFDPRRVLLGDIDGDGLADLVYVGADRVTVWLNQAGERWGEPVIIEGTPPFSDVDAVRLDDVLGAGTAGILWTSDRLAGVPDQHAVLDLTGGRKPYLLESIDNHRGAVTRIEYAPSTRFFVADRDDARTAWKTSLPAPVQVVARIETLDLVSRGKISSELRYRHGYWDGLEREFRGFGLVDRIDSETFDAYHRGDTQEPVPREHFAPPVVTRTWFHLGAAGGPGEEPSELDFAAEGWDGDRAQLPRPESMRSLLDRLPSAAARRDALRTLRGAVLRTELYALDGSEREGLPYTVTETLHAVESLPIGAPWPDDPEPWRTRVFLPRVVAERVTRWERGAEPQTRAVFTGDLDGYGQPRSRLDVALPRAAGEPVLATLETTIFAQRDDEVRFIVDRVARARTFEIVGETARDLAELERRVSDGVAQRRLIAETNHAFDGEAFVGLPLGQLGERGALVRTEALVATAEIFQEAYRQLPPYLDPAGARPWPAEYPATFRASVAPLAGHVFRAGEGYFASTEQRRYDFHEGRPGRGLVTAQRDALGRETTLEYDELALLPRTVTQPPALPGGTPLVTRAEHDYRLFMPCRTEDPNGNASACRFTPLGLVASIAVLGKTGDEADTEDEPGVRFDYDLHAFARGQPTSVHTSRRVHHVRSPHVPADPAAAVAVVEQRDYSDGFGRIIQTRSAAADLLFLADGPRGGAGLPLNPAHNGPATGTRRDPAGRLNVTVSGWQRYDNKGRVVAAHEPYFAVGWELAPPAAAELGLATTTFYDAVGRVVRTVLPDGSERRRVFGIPHDLADPGRFAPSPWTAYSYDANDNAGRTHGAASAPYREHWNTPASEVFDALGRAVERVERAGAGEEMRARVTYDARGNPIAVEDLGGRVPLRQTFDLAGRAIRTETLDGGSREAIYDALGATIERRDTKGGLALAVHDRLNRPRATWARDAADEAVTLRELIVYGDAAGAALPTEAARRGNLLGVPWRHHDEAGLVLIERRDVKGEAIEKVRQVLSDRVLIDAAAADATFRVDWEPPAGVELEAHAEGLLDAAPYRTTMAYDALGRPILVRAPADVEGRRRDVRLGYDRAGRLDRAELDGAIFVEHIAYDARGQRTLVALGNGVITRYAYDPATFRVRRMRSERAVGDGSGDGYRPTGEPLHDVAYTHDLVGNVLSARDGAVPDDARAFAYDALYRLVSATGRECDLPPPADPWGGPPRCPDLTRTRPYRQTYTYDATGNLLALRHRAAGADFTREFTLAGGSNRVSTLTVGASEFAYRHDACGNLVEETAARHFEWDHRDRMRAYRTRAGAAPPSLHAHYLYDPGGRRVKKLVRKQGGQLETTVYIDGIFERHAVAGGGGMGQNDTLHVLQGNLRVASRRVGAALPGDTLPPVRYHLRAQLGSSAVTASDAGDVLDREEYKPFGETSHSSVALERYRFSGKEQDEESGLVYFGARYQSSWTGRFASCDPAGVADGLNGYAYARNNPVTLTDPTGMQAVAEGAPAGGKWADFDNGLQIYYNADGVPEWAAIDGAVYDRPLPVSNEVITIFETAPGPAWHAQAFRPAAGSYDVVPYGSSVDTGNAVANVAANGLVGVWNLVGGLVNVVTNGVGELSALPAKGMVAVGAAPNELEADRMMLSTPIPFDDMLVAFRAGLRYVHAGNEARDAVVAAGELKSGAGGGWKVVNEIEGGAISQVTKTSCGAACGEMLSGKAQDELIRLAGAPTDAETLAKVLGPEFRSGYVTPDQLEKLMGLGRPWIADLREGGRLGHFVVVDGINAAGRVVVRDPWGAGSAYEMTVADFLHYWSGVAVFR